MSCEWCGSSTPLRLCKSCTRAEMYAQMHATGDFAGENRVNVCAECGEKASGGAYSENRPGVWLCRDCMTEDDVSGEVAV